MQKALLVVFLVTLACVQASREIGVDRYIRGTKRIRDSSERRPPTEITEDFSLGKAFGFDPKNLEDAAQEYVALRDVIRPAPAPKIIPSNTDDIENFNLGPGRIMRSRPGDEVDEQENLVISDAIRPPPKILLGRPPATEDFSLGKAYGLPSLDEDATQENIMRPPPEIENYNLSPGRIMRTRRGDELEDVVIGDIIRRPMSIKPPPVAVIHIPGRNVVEYLTLKDVIKRKRAAENNKGQIVPPADGN